MVWDSLVGPENVKQYTGLTKDLQGQNEKASSAMFSSNPANDLWNFLEMSGTHLSDSVLRSKGSISYIFNQKQRLQVSLNHASQNLGPECGLKTKLKPTNRKLWVLYSPVIAMNTSLHVTIFAFLRIYISLCTFALKFHNKNQLKS